MKRFQARRLDRDFGALRGVALSARNAAASIGGRVSRHVAHDVHKRIPLNT